MPVRKVPKNSRNLTGLVPNTRTSSMTAFASALERDVLLRLDFDPEVTFDAEQPVTIAYQDDQGRRRRSPPDVLVRSRTDHLPLQHLTPLLCAVQYRTDRRQPGRAYRPKFRAVCR